MAELPFHFSGCVNVPVSKLCMRVVYVFLHGTTACCPAGGVTGGLRIAGDGGTRGRLEVCYQRQWGAVCAYNFLDEDVEVRPRAARPLRAFPGWGKRLPG